MSIFQAMFGGNLHQTRAGKPTGQAATHNFVYVVYVLHCCCTLKFLWNVRILELLPSISSKIKVYSVSVSIYIHFHRLKLHEVGAFAHFFECFGFFELSQTIFSELVGTSFCGTVIVSSKLKYREMCWF